MTADEAVELVARALHERRHPVRHSAPVRANIGPRVWEETQERERERYREDARAVLVEAFVAGCDGVEP